MSPVPRAAASAGLSVVLVAVALAGCRDVPPPVTVDADRITVFNRTDHDWTNLEIRVNQYYVVQVPRLGPDGRFDVPITRLQGGFGRYFDPTRERVRTVVVTGTARDGSAVKLEWGPS